MNTIPNLVLAARIALKALATRLRAGLDATLETADACAALRALADAWASVLPRLPADVTPPEWPVWGRPAFKMSPPSPHGVAAALEFWSRDGWLDVDITANALDAYADGLRAWGREANVCEEELGAEDGGDEPAPYTLSALADPTPLPRGPEPIPLAYREPIDCPAAPGRL